MAGILFIISAPSGSGKSTLVSELRKQVSGVEFAISWTTRPPRGSEENGREYNFTSREEFQRMLDTNVFLEHAEVFGNFYGTARHSLDEARSAGHDLLLDIDVQGAKQVMRRMPDAVSILSLIHIWHPKVAKYIRQFPQTLEFLDKATEMLKFLLPHYIEEGKSYLTVAFGCTGGQHRSVFIAEAVSYTHLHRQQDDERQKEALILRRQRQVNH